MVILTTEIRNMEKNRNCLRSPYNCLTQFQEPLLSPHLDGLSARQGWENVAWLKTNTKYAIDLSCVHTRPEHDKFNHEWNFFIMKSVHIKQWSARIMVETTSQSSFNHDKTKHVQNGGWMQRGGECPNGARTHNTASPYEIAKAQSKRAVNYWACRKRNILYPRKRKCLLLVKCCCIALLLLPRAWKLTLNQRMNATVTIISSSIIQLKSKTFMRAPWNSINEACLKPTSDVNAATTNIFRRNVFPWNMFTFNHVSPLNVNTASDRNEKSIL